jgi:hypothetical protein
MIMIMISSSPFGPATAGCGERAFTWAGVEMKSLGIGILELSLPQTRQPSGGQVIRIVSKSGGRHLEVPEAQGHISFRHSRVPPNLVQYCLFQFNKKSSSTPEGTAGNLQVAELLDTSQNLAS